MGFDNISWPHLLELLGLFALAFFLGFFLMWLYFKLFGATSAANDGAKNEGDATTAGQAAESNKDTDKPGSVADEKATADKAVNAEGPVDVQEKAPEIEETAPGKLDVTDLPPANEAIVVEAPSEEGEAPQPAAMKAGVKKDGPDDLKLIKGIGPTLEKKLNKLDVTQFAQIADWTDEDVARVNEVLSFSGRIAREDWIGQAKKLAAGEETEFSKQAKKS